MTNGVKLRLIRCPDCGKPVKVMAPKGTPRPALLALATCRPGEHRKVRTTLSKTDERTWAKMKADAKRKK
jgi:hypothetical protein